jgi:hypothetical protein
MHAWHFETHVEAATACAIISPLTHLNCPLWNRQQAGLQLDQNFSLGSCSNHKVSQVKLTACTLIHTHNISRPRATVADEAPPSGYAALSASRMYTAAIYLG